MPAITDNGNGQALVSWAALKGMFIIIGLLVTISIGSLALAAKGGARDRQVEINTADIQAIQTDLTDLKVGQATIIVALKDLKDRR